MILASVLTMSDKGAAGLRQDTSGPALCKRLEEAGIKLLSSGIIADERDLISATLVRLCADGADLIITTGGTGLSPRDITPEATLDVIERKVPGIPEAMRMAGLQKTSRAMLSRGIAGIRGRTLIINLPGSPLAAMENLEAIMDVLPHAIEKLKGSKEDCAR